MIKSFMVNPNIINFALKLYNFIYKVALTASCLSTPDCSRTTKYSTTNNHEIIFDEKSFKIFTYHHFGIVGKLCRDGCPKTAGRA